MRAAHRRKYDQHSAIADPKFVNAVDGDFRLGPDSPAYALGFEDIDYAAIGLRSDFPFADPADPLDRVFCDGVRIRPWRYVEIECRR
jgi:hypothetical protein